MVVILLDGVECDHEMHSCKDNSFVWIREDLGFIFLENPKACSTYVKTELVEQNDKGTQIPRSEVASYPGFKVFGIYREPKERLFSVFRDFTKSENQLRIEQMQSLWSYEAGAVEGVSFSEFLDLALVHKDHHWSPNFPYLFIPGVDVTLFYYHPEVMREVESFLGMQVNKPPLASSAPYDHEIAQEEEKKIRQLMRLDYENEDYFWSRIVNREVL